MQPSVLSTPTQPVAVFDLDGTLTRRDTFLPFLVSYAWRQRRFLPLLWLPFYVVAYVCRLISDRTAKQRLIVHFCGHQREAVLCQHAAWFARTWLPQHLRPAGMAKLREHQLAGHRIVLVSASPSLYVPAIAEYLGIPETICTCVKIADGVCTGAIVGPNCKGTHKVSLVQAYLGTKAAPVESFAYGDSRADLPILGWVSSGFKLSRGAFHLVPSTVPCAAASRS
jgi:phosphatidylglycerophosphatase C